MKPSTSSPGRKLVYASVSFKRARMKAAQQRDARVLRGLEKNAKECCKLSGCSEQDEQVELPTETETQALPWVASHMPRI